MRNYAVLGGAGFIGSHFVDALLAKGNKVIVVDNLCSGTFNHVKIHISNPLFRLIEVNIQDTKRLIETLSGVDTVIHLASNPDIAAAMNNPRIDFEQGTMLTESVMEAVRKLGIEKVLYASGSGVYGEVGLTPVQETDLLLPVSPYGASKLAGESLLSAYSYMFDFKSIAFRFANVVGPRQTHGVGYDFIRKLKENPSELSILGDGTQTKSYIHVSDIVSGVLHLESQALKNYDVFNLSTDDTLSVREIAELSISVMGLERKKVQFKFSGGDRGWKGDVPKIRLDSNKIRSTGWAPSKNCKEAMLHSLESMRDELRS